ncbi:Spermidine synthase [Enhygromyxa salina]|uniref:Spermidine synthase n=1 Tax=Enhygromyxa salina TaxID=215803 RepID=A0A2S9XR71_9BACT|nr:fused MFS/spermidine synthase [Enhygromyxa salina]PRP95355.1 Spermidine synthase [Enhygromyxa salina]
MGRSRHLFLLFFLSGLSGLVYESLWSRYLKLFVGSAATAQVLVLALFMGGMSLGSLLAGRYSARIRKPVLAYGIIEGLIGLYALAFPYLYTGVTRFCYDVLFPAVGGGGVGAVKWTAAALLIAPPCILLGTTFPLMSVGILRRDRERSGEILSFLYFSNSFGASLGALLSGFLLVPWLGLPGTLATAAALNFAIMAITLRERGREADAPLTAGDEADEADAPPRDDTDSEPEPRAAATQGPSLLTLMLLIALGTGLSSFMYEIAWIRMLSMVLGSATHSFEVMLSVFVLGLALGGLWVRKRMDKFKRPELTLGLVQLIMGVAAVATIPLYRLGVLGIGGVFWVSTEYLDGERTMSLWYLFNAVRYVTCLVIMLPATFCAGMTLPLVTHVLLRRGRPESAVGKVYGVNTLGSIAGAISAGLILLPLIGIKAVIVLGAMLDMGLGVWLVAREQALRPSKQVRKLVRSTTVAAAAVAVIGLGVLDIDPRTLASGVFRRGTVKMHDDYIVRLHEDGRTATVTVTEDEAREGYHTLFTNGKPDASIYTLRWPEGHDPAEGPMLAGDEPTQLLLAIIPLLANPDARLAATIGMGSGVSSHTLLASPKLERLDTVEIEPFMAEGAKLFHPVNRRTFEDPRSHIIFDDAKAYFAAAEARYDLVVSEPSNPWVAGVSSLFTTEFYDEIKRYLADDGLLGQWIHGYELSDELLLSVLAAVDSSFEDYRIYRVGNRDWLILASQQQGGVGDLSAEAFAWPELEAEAGLLGIHGMSQIESLLVANDELLRPYLRTLQPNTDADPVLDNGAEKARFFKRSAEVLLELRFYPLPLVEVLGGVERAPYVERIADRRADQHVLEEPERASVLMRLWELDDHKAYAGTASIRSYFTQRTNLAAHPGEASYARAWLDAVYGVYHLSAPWIALDGTGFWTEVLDTARSEAVTPEVRRAVEIFDLIERRDGAKLWAAVEGELGREDSVLHPRILALAGATALVLEDASVERRRGFATEHMRPQMVEPVATSEDIAFAMIVAWMEQ